MLEHKADGSRGGAVLARRSRRARVRDLALLLPAAIMVTGVSAFAQVPASQPATTEQRASDQAFQHLIDEVMAVRLAGGWTVGGLLSVVPDADRGLRESILSARQESRARRLSGDIAEIEVSLSTERLAEMLQDIAARFFPKADRAVFEFESRRGSSITGVGRLADDAAIATSPVGWRHCDERQLNLVQAAAETDFRQHLMERVGQWRLTPTQTVGQLWGRFPAFRQAATRRVQAIKLPKPIFEPTGVCRVSNEIGRTGVLEVLVKGAEDSGDAIEVDLTRAVDPEFQDPLILDGFAVTPPVAPVEAAGVDADGGRGHPDWIGGTLSVTIVGQPPANITSQEARRKLAVNIAKIEAKRQLWLQIEQLPLPGSITVAGLLEYVGRPPQALTSIESTIQSAGTPSYDGQDNATVTLTARLDLVWDIVRGIWPTKGTGMPG